MTFPLSTSLTWSQRSTRLLAATLSVLAVATLTACGSSKFSSASLESLKSEVTVATVWSQRLGAVSSALTLSANQGVITTASTDGEVVALDGATGTVKWRAQAKSLHQFQMAIAVFLTAEHDSVP